VAKGQAVLNFRFRADAQTGTSQREGVNTFAKNFANILINQVAIASKEETFKAARDRLVNRVDLAVNREIAQMSFMVAKFLTQPERASGPTGTITGSDPTLSKTASNLRWRVREYDLSKSGIHWAERQRNYMLWKHKHGHSSDWWKLHGGLAESLNKASFYTTNFGPVKVEFIRSSATGDIKNVTSTGSGRPTVNLNVGTISVSVMGKLTPEMLPSLASGDPTGNVAPSGKRNLTRLITDQSVSTKLGHGGPGGQYRPVLEPFLAYFLTRAIPNAVFRVTEKLVSDVSVRDDRNKGLGTSGKGDGFLA
jgi:hypothetical protein